MILPILLQGWLNTREIAAWFAWNWHTKYFMLVSKKKTLSSLGQVTVTLVDAENFDAKGQSIACRCHKKTGKGSKGNTTFSEFFVLGFRWSKKLSYKHVNCVIFFQYHVWLRRQINLLNFMFFLSCAIRYLFIAPFDLATFSREAINKHPRD